MKLPEYKKGPMGHYAFDLRRAIQKMGHTCAEWCKAFDAGDTQALDDLSKLLQESGQGMCEAAEKINDA